MDINAVFNKLLFSVYNHKKDDHVQSLTLYSLDDILIWNHCY